MSPAPHVSPAPYERVPGLTPHDLGHIVSRNWLPVTTFAVLEEMRVKHEALIDKREAVGAELTALTERFAEEDRAFRVALEDGYRTQTEPDLPERTAPEQREAAINDAAAHSNAAARAVVAFACECLDRLRGEVPDGWKHYIEVQNLKAPPNGEAATLLNEIGEQEHALGLKIETARAVIDEAQAELRAVHPLKVWIAQTGNGASGQIEPGRNLPIAPAYTPGSKPRALPVTDWWPDEVPEATEEAEQHIVNAQHDGDGGIYEFADEPAAPISRRSL